MLGNDSNEKEEPMEIHRHKWLGLFGICILAFTAYLDFTIVNTALPFIQKAFDINILQLQWVSNIFSIIVSMTMIASGKFGDLWGRKRVFYFGVVIFAIAALGAGLSPNLGLLIFFRGLQAAGASILFICSTALISETFSGDFRYKAIGIYGGVTGLGLMMGPFFGGILIGLLNWRWVFWVNLPLIVIGLICCLISLRAPSHKVENVEIDYKGFFLLIVGLGALLYGIIAGGASGWSSLFTWIPIIIGLLFLGLLIWIDLRSHAPLLYFAIFKDPLIILATLSCSLAGIVSYVLMFFDPLYLRNVKELSPFSIGMLIAIIPAAQVVISFGFNTLLKSIGVANLLFISILAALLATFLHLFFAESTSYWYMALPFALLGINWGLSNTAMITAVNQNVTSKKIGEGIGTIATIWNTSGSIFLAISTVIYDLKGNEFLPGFYAAVEFNILFMVVVALAALWTRLKLSASS